MALFDLGNGFWPGLSLCPDSLWPNVAFYDPGWISLTWDCTLWPDNWMALSDLLSYSLTQYRTLWPDMVLSDLTLTLWTLLSLMASWTDQKFGTLFVCLFYFWNNNIYLYKVLFVSESRTLPVYLFVCLFGSRKQWHFFWHSESEWYKFSYNSLNHCYKFRIRMI